MSAERIMVGLSGGVDSAVAAALLQRQGYLVEALFMKNWEEEDSEEHCSAATDLADARAVADRLKIPLHTVNFSHEYWERVFRHFLEEYATGRTPNPDILCNREIKFRAFLDHARRLGAQRIATGHYARTETGREGIRLLQGEDPDKDQSYFLHLLDQQQLEASHFPLGALRKTAVRELAQTLGLANAAKRDSTGICFIGERHFRTFLGRYLPAQPGEIVTTTGEVIGQHQGLMYHTLGQRRGLQIGGLANHPELPWYVVAKELSQNRLIVAQKKNHPRLMSTRVRCGALHWITPPQPPLPLSCEARHRYRQPRQPCTLISTENGETRVHFDTPQRAVTPGQSIVFYLGEQCLGGAVIESAQ